MHYAIYVPAEDSELGLPKGSAILGLLRHGQTPERTVAVASPNGRRGRGSSFADFCREAVPGLHGRGAKTSFPAASLLEVGIWDESEGVARLQHSGHRALSAWIGHVAHRNDLEAADSRHNVRQGARQDMRRAFIQGRPDKAAQIASRHGLSGW